MFFSLKPDCYFRHYGKIGHIVRPILSMEEVVDECGALFIEQLEYEPEEIDTIVKKLEQLQTVHQEQSCWAVFLFGGDAYSVSAFQNHHR